jgi:tetratricopeptide (TPR) repeat protein
MIAEDEGEFAEARALYEQSLSVWQADADQYGVARALLHLGGAATAQGDSIAAHGYLVRALELMKRMDDVAGIALVLERCARLAAAQQQPTRALTLAGAVTALRERVGIPRPANVAAEIDAALSPAREVLGTTAAKAWAEGEALTVEQTISLATSPL